MDLNINTVNNSCNAKYKPSFGSSAESVIITNLIKSLPAISKPVAWFVSSQENSSGLSHTRFIQDTTTNWVPKAAFSRSKADIAEMSFLEFSESALFYYAPALLGEYIFRRQIFSKFLPENIRHNLAEPVSELIKNPALKNNGAIKKLLPLKAAIVISCICIPAAEYAVSFAKNLFTLKVFKKADFNNVVNLEKDKHEDPEFQKKVKNSAHKHIKKAGIISGLSLGSGILLALFGHRSKVLQGLSRFVLQPGAEIASALEKIGFKSAGFRKFMETYFALDFANNKGKLCLSKGQLTASVIAGVFGYFGAAKDRGRLDSLEVATRVPLVAAYTIFGSSLFDHGFKKYLFKNEKYPDLICKNLADNSLNVPKLNDLPELAKKLAQKNSTSFDDEFKRLFKQKAVITTVPFVSSLAVMGFLIAGISRFWTQYRFNHGIGRKSKPSVKNDVNIDKNIFKKFCGSPGIVKYM